MNTKPLVVLGVAGMGVAGAAGLFQPKPAFESEVRPVQVPAYRVSPIDVGGCKLQLDSVTFSSSMMFGKEGDPRLGVYAHKSAQVTFSIDATEQPVPVLLKELEIRAMFDEKGRAVEFTSPRADGEVQSDAVDGGLRFATPPEIAPGIAWYGNRVKYYTRSRGVSLARMPAGLSRLEGSLVLLKPEKWKVVDVPLTDLGADPKEVFPGVTCVVVKKAQGETSGTTQFAAYSGEVVEGYNGPILNAIAIVAENGLIHEAGQIGIRRLGYHAVEKNDFALKNARSVRFQIVEKWSRHNEPFAFTKIPFVDDTFSNQTKP